MEATAVFDFEAIGTKWRIEIYDEKFAGDKATIEKNLLDKILQRIAVFDKNYSRFRDDSLVSEMAKKAGTYALPADAEPLFSLYQNFYKLSGGIFTPLVGQLLVDAGYDAEYSLQPKHIQKVPSWDEVLDYHFTTLNLKKPALLDFGAAGKGYLIDIIGALLKANNINSFCIDAGGDILYKTPTDQNLQIGLEHPGNTKQVIGIANIKNQSICGSASNRRSWGKFHHIMDPKTLESTNKILATWVIAETAMLADAIATCLFFVPSKKIAQEYNFEYLLVFPDYTIEKSTDFPAELFIKN